MTNQEAIEKFKKIKRGNIFLIHQRIEGKEVIEDYSLCDMAISALQAQEETVSRKVYEQISWERDIAVMQLKDLGYGLGEKIRTDGGTISRQAAIDEIKALYEWHDTVTEDRTIDHLKRLPSAQPEKLTDKEQRIFLSAMGREEEVCKEVDDAWRDCREPYEDSLVHVCKEIRRKVKGALWT